MKRVILCVLVLMVHGIAQTKVEYDPKVGTTVVDSLYQVALALPDSMSIKTRINAFRRVLKRDFQYAPAHNQIAWLYLKWGKTETRQSARFAIDRALEIDPDNVDYQLTKGAVLWFQHFYLDAVEHYTKLLERHPDCADAAYWLGYYYVNEFMDYKDRREAVKSGPTTEMGEEVNSGFIAQLGNSQPKDPSLSKLQREARLRDSAFILYDAETVEAHQNAVKYLQHCIQAAPDYRDAYYQLGLAYLESGRADSMVATIQRFLERHPEDKDGLLFSGLGYIAMGKPGHASQQFEGALAYMASDERAALEDVALISSDNKRHVLARAEKRLAFARAESLEAIPATWADTPERANFWRSQDPLFLTDFNERRIEHYARFAYSNLRFSVPRANVEGWRTDRGKTYIKFGRYRYRRSSGGGESWIYEGFQFQFQNTVYGSLAGRIFNWHIGDILPRMAGPYMRDPWALTDKPDDRERIEESQRHRYISDIHIEPSQSEVFKKTPPRYIDPYKKQKYTLPHLIAAFYERDSVRLEIAYAVPKRRIKTLPDGQIGIIDGLFLFDEHWNETYRNPTVVTLPAPPAAQAHTQADSLRNRYFTTTHTVYVSPGTYHLAAEVVDRNSGAIGAFRQPYDIDSCGTAFTLSDLLLATRIEPQTAFPESRADLHIDLNPLRAFHRTEPAGIYLELYNLKRDAFGRTKYEIAYRISRPEDKEIDPALFADLDLPEGTLEIRQVEAPRDDAGNPAVAYELTYTVPQHNLVTEGMQKRTHGLFRKHPETTITAQYEGDQVNDFTYLQIDIGHVPAGVHKLTVIAQDLSSGKKFERELIFRVLG